MDAIIGQDYTTGVLFEDGDGPIDGLTDVVLNLTDEATGLVIGGITAAACSESPAASGYYQYTIDDALITQPGRWRSIFTSATGELRAEGYIDVGYYQPWMRRRREIRFAIGKSLWPNGQVLMQQTTGAGTTTTFTLPRTLVGGINQYRGMWARFSTGLNRAQARPIYASTAGGGTPVVFTVFPALPAAVGANDWVEIYPEDPEILDRVIDSAFDLLSDRMVRHAETRRSASDGVTEYFQLPSDARYVYEVTAISDAAAGEGSPFNPHMWELSAGGKIRILTPRSSPSDGWPQVPSLENPFGWIYTGGMAWPDNYTFRIKMLVRSSPPLYDDSFIEFPAQPFVSLCVALGQEERFMRGGSDVSPIVAQIAMRRQSEAIRRLTPQLPVNTRAVVW